MFNSVYKYSEFIKSLLKKNKSLKILEISFYNLSSTYQFPFERTLINLSLDECLESISTSLREPTDLSLVPTGSYDVVCCFSAQYIFNFDRCHHLLHEIYRISNKFVYLATPVGDLVKITEDYFSKTIDSLGLDESKFKPYNTTISFPSTNKILKLLLSFECMTSISINEYAYDHYSSLLFDRLYLASEKIYNIFKSKSKSNLFFSPTLVEDIPFSLAFSVDKDLKLYPSINAFNFKISSQKYNENSKVDIFSVFDRQLEISNKLIDIHEFYVKNFDSTYVYSLKNPSTFHQLNNHRCSEISAISYILSMDLKSDILGFCHYRRYLNLDDDSDDLNIPYSDFSTYQNKFDSAVKVSNILNEYDLIVGTPISLNNTIENHYALYHYASDYYVMCNVILHNYTYLTDSLHESMQSTYLYASNILYGNSELVRNIFNTVLEILEKVSAFICVDNRSVYQQRDIAFLSERVFDIIIRYCLYSKVRLKTLPRINIV